MLKRSSVIVLLFSAAFLLSAAPLLEVFRVDKSIDCSEAVNIEKKGDAFAFNSLSRWELPASFDTANAEIELSAELDLVPVDPAKKRTYSHFYHFSDVNKKTIASMLFVRYPDRPGQALINFTAFDRSGKMIVCERQVPIIEKNGSHTITVKMEPAGFILMLDGKILRRVKHNSRFNRPAMINLGKHNGSEPAAGMKLKKFVIRSI